MALDSYILYAADVVPDGCIDAIDMSFEGCIYAIDMDLIPHSWVEWIGIKAGIRTNRPGVDDGVASVASAYGGLVVDIWGFPTKSELSSYLINTKKQILPWLYMSLSPSPSSS